MRQCISRRFAGTCLLLLAGAICAFGGIFAEAATTPIAYLYVTVKYGVNLYTVGANGTLTLVQGSPFPIKGLMIGSNGKHLITVGTYWIHSYAVRANGAIGPQVSQINTQSYDGNACGSTDGGILDHSGQDVYVLLNVPADPNNPVCLAYQAFHVDPNTGALTFNGANEIDTSTPGNASLPAFTSDNHFAYTTNWTGRPAEEAPAPAVAVFARESNGTLQPKSVYVTYPQAPDGPYYYFPTGVVATTNDDLVMPVFSWYDPPEGTFGPRGLATFSVDPTTGNATSTNTYQNTPSPDISWSEMQPSWDGKFLAFSGGEGLQLFHLNGSAPLTKFGPPILSDEIDGTYWDKANHLYAISKSTNKLHVYNVTGTQVTEAPGSPYSVNQPITLFVRPL